MFLIFNFKIEFDKSKYSGFEFNPLMRIKNFKSIKFIPIKWFYSC